MATVPTAEPGGAGRRSTLFTVPEKIIPAAWAIPGKLTGIGSLAGGLGVMEEGVYPGVKCSGTKSKGVCAGRGARWTAALRPRAAGSATISSESASRQRTVLQNKGTTSANHLLGGKPGKRISVFPGRAEVSDRCHNRL